MSSGYDEFVDDLLIEEKYGTKNKDVENKPMSDNPKDTIKGKSVVSQKGSLRIDEFQKYKRWAARWRHENNLQKYRMDEIKIEGDKLIIDEEKYQKRIEDEKKLMENHYKIENESTGSIPFRTEDLPQFNPKQGFKAYDKEKWDKEGKLIVE